LRYVAKRAVELVAIANILTRLAIPGLLVGVSQVLGIGQVFLVSLEVQLVILQTGNALHQASTARNDNRQ
jgi:hypothetical protein